jgi:hypothetical protein
VPGKFVLSIDTEDPIEPQSRHPRWSAGDRRIDAAREATHRFMRLLDGHALAATWVVGEAAVFEAWGRRRSDGIGEPSDSLVGAVTAMATRQEIAVSPSHGRVATPGGDTRLERCSRFAQWNDYEVRTLALPADAAIDAARYAALGFTACRQTLLATRPSPLSDDLFQRPLPMWRISDLDLAGPILMVPVSVTIASIDSRRRLVPEAARIARIRKALDQAAREEALVHAAFRLTDLEHSEALFRTVEDILFHVAEARASGALQVATVAGVRLAYDVETGGAVPRRAA